MSSDNPTLPLLLPTQQTTLKKPLQMYRPAHGVEGQEADIVVPALDPHFQGYSYHFFGYTRSGRYTRTGSVEEARNGREVGARERLRCAVRVFAATESFKRLQPPCATITPFTGDRVPAVHPRLDFIG